MAFFTRLIMIPDSLPKSFTFSKILWDTRKNALNVESFWESLEILKDQKLLKTSQAYHNHAIRPSSWLYETCKIISHDRILFRSSNNFCLAQANFLHWIIRLEFCNKLLIHLSSTFKYVKTLLKYRKETSSVFYKAWQKRQSLCC